jgi:hypothetical protein
MNATKIASKIAKFNGHAHEGECSGDCSEDDGSSADEEMLA